MMYEENSELTSALCTSVRVLGRYLGDIKIFAITRASFSAGSHSPLYYL